MLPLGLDETLRTAAPYQRGPAVLTLAVAGEPIPQGSKAFKGTRRDGRAILAESSPRLKPWRALITATALAVRNQTPAPVDGWPLLGPVAVDLIFTMPKPRSAPKLRRTWPAVAPDVDKLARGCLDALTYAQVYRDDAQVVDLHACKAYPGEAPGALRVPGVRITIYRIEHG